MSIHELLKPHCCQLLRSHGEICLSSALPLFRKTTSCLRMTRQSGCMQPIRSPGSSLARRFIASASSLRQASVMASSSPMGSQQQPLRILDPVSFTQRVLEVFDARGSTGKYEEEAGQWHLPIAQELVQRAGLRAGQDVLDIATGTGLVAELAAKAVAPGSVIGIDISPGMLAQAAPRAAANPNLSFHKADAQLAQFEPASFDVILCSNALIYMLDVPAALKHWAGWLRPGGKLCFNTPQSPFLKSQPIFLRAARSQGLWLEDPAQVVGTPNNVLKALTHAGFDASLIKVDAQAQKDYSSGWTPQEYADRLWGVHLRFFPVDKVLSPEAVNQMRQEWQDKAQLYAQQEMKEHGSRNELPTMLWVEAVSSS